MLRTLPIIIALILVVAAGIVHGRHSQRWETSRAIENAVNRVDRLPMKLGDWQGKALELDPAQLAVGEIAGYVARHYEDRLHGDAVTILLVCGAPGPISVHTPDICYAGAGFEQIGPQAIVTVPSDASGSPTQFRSILMEKSNALASSYLQIRWAWSAAGKWEIPDNPRLAFASNAALYKLYVITAPSSASESPDQDPSPRFLKILLPELQRALFEPVD